MIDVHFFSENETEALYDTLFVVKLCPNWFVSTFPDSSFASPYSDRFFVTISSDHIRFDGFECRRHTVRKGFDISTNKDTKNE